MGPDCGTAIINGVGLGFANRVRRGAIGLVGASGTGLQAIVSRIHELGAGVSHAIGTGGRDLKAEVGAITPADFSIVNQPGARSYPISGYSWALVYTHQPSQATGQKLVSMLDWLTHSGQAYAAAIGYVPLPPQIQQLAQTMLKQITGPGGTHLLG